MLNKHLKFSHGYDKLRNDEYSTIRGKSKAMNYHTGQIVGAHCHNEFLHDAKITMIALMKIREIPLKVLKQDIAPFKMRTKTDFIKFLNTFRRFNKLKSVEDEVSLFILEKVKN